MHIQLDLDEMFDLNDSSSKPSSKLRTPSLSVISEYQNQPAQPRLRLPRCELDNSGLFRGSSTGSIELQTSEQTFVSTEAMPSHYEMPGERLYYEHRHNLVRKLKDLEKWKYEMTQKEKDVLTFTPIINKNTIKILNARDQNPQNQIKANQRKLMKLKEYEDLENLKKLKNFEECTFKPQIDKKTEQLTRDRSDDVFLSLYHESKMKEIRQKVKQQIPQPINSAHNKQAVENFMQRNSLFLERTIKKKNLMEQTSLHYDLSTGEKLFTPRISKQSPKMQYSRSGAIFHKNSSLHHLNDKLKQKFEQSLKDSVDDQIHIGSPNIEGCFDE